VRRTPRFSAVLFDLFDTLCRIDEPVYREGKRRELDGARALGMTAVRIEAAPSTPRSPTCAACR